jgi:hypothetical protein
MATQSVSISREAAGETSWSIGRWVAVNAVGLGTALALFALFGGTVEALGAEHDGWPRDLSLLAAFMIGGGTRAYLRQRTLLPCVPRVGRVAAVTIIALTAGFVGGFVIGGPPLDFILGIFAVGSVAGGAEWFILRRQLPRPGRLALIAAVGWLVASVLAIVPAALFGDAIDAAVAGPELLGFVAILLMIGLAGGAVGGAIEAVALRSRVKSS